MNDCTVILLILFAIQLIASWVIFDLGRFYQKISVNQIRIGKTYGNGFIDGWMQRAKICRNNCIQRDPKTGRMKKRGK